jgi:AAA domain
MTFGLPKPLTSFIGRERELAQAKQLLQGSYLVTLTGPGGSGKTRLCVAVAGEVAGDYPDGVYFVPLAPVRDPGLVPSTIVQSIGLQDARDVPLMEHLISQLRERQVLIVLDNFEHLLAGAPVVTRLLRETSAVRILVTSRAPLHVSGEQECRSRRWQCRTWTLARRLCRWRPASRCACSPSERPARSQDSLLMTRTRRRSRRSPAGSTACRWPSSWRRRGSSCCRLRESCPGWITRWAC